MGTHITIGEFIVIGVLTILVYTLIKTAVEYIKNK